MNKQLSIPTTIHNDLVNDDLTTSSLTVAKKFKKRHDNVIQAIKSLDVPADWLALNFKEKQNIVPIANGATRTSAYYEMTRDGFVILVMGFTGKIAMTWKLKFLDAFNQMEAQLLGNSEPLEIDTPSTKTDREPLTNLVNTFVSVAPVSYRDAWAMVKAHLKTSKAAAELTVSEVGRALVFVQEKIDLHTAKPIGFDYPDAQVGIITELALQGARRFSLTISLGQKHTKSTGLITKQFKADIYLFEEAAIEPKGLSYSVRSIG